VAVKFFYADEIIPFLPPVSKIKFNGSHKAMKNAKHY
jgi:hypothetical protein